MAKDSKYNKKVPRPLSDQHFIDTNFTFLKESGEAMIGARKLTTLSDSMTKREAINQVMSGALMFSDIKLVIFDGGIQLRVVPKGIGDAHVFTEPNAILEFIRENALQLKEQFGDVFERLLKALSITEKKLMQIKSTSKAEHDHESYLSSVYAQDKSMWHHESQGFYSSVGDKNRGIKNNLFKGLTYFTDVEWYSLDRIFVIVSYRRIILTSRDEIRKFLEANDKRLKEKFFSFSEKTPAIYHSINVKLSQAIADNQLNYIPELVHQGADINFLDEKGYTPLMNAIKNKNEALVDVLLTQGADVTVKKDLSYLVETALLLATQQGSLSMVKKLLTYGAEITFDVVRSTVFHNEIDLLKYFIDKENIDIETKDSFGRTLLHLAASDGKSNAVEFLLKRGANMNIESRIQGETVLHLAINEAPMFLSDRRAGAYINVVKLLLQNGANVSTNEMEFAKSHRDYLYQVIQRHAKKAKAGCNPFILLPSKKHAHDEEKALKIMDKMNIASSP